jgi:hypothetical protein
MGKLIMQVIRMAIVLAIIIGLIAGVGYLFILAIDQGATVAAAMLAAGATVAGAALVRYFERRRVMEAIRREHLGDLYLSMAAVLTGQEIPQDQRDEVVGDFLRKSLVYSSARTLKVFREWRAALPSVEPWPQEELRPNTLRYEVFVKAMRRDLGISNFMLQEGDLARTVQLDFDDHM